MKDSVDVVIPTFNSSETIFKTVNSCLSQTFPVDKIIVIDDGSSESEIQFLKDHFSKFRNIKIIFNRHRGYPGIGRRLGIEDRSSKWIAFLDSDDYWVDNKIEKQLEHAQDNQSKVISTNASIFGQEKLKQYFSATCRKN